MVLSIGLNLLNFLLDPLAFWFWATHPRGLGDAFSFGGVLGFPNIRNKIPEMKVDEKPGLIILLEIKRVLQHALERCFAFASSRGSERTPNREAIKTERGRGERKKSR